jgi:hypothetical protein
MRHDILTVTKNGKKVYRVRSYDTAYIPAIEIEPKEFTSKKELLKHISKTLN